MKGQNVKKKKKKTKTQWKHAKNDGCSQDATFRYMVAAELFPEQKPAARNCSTPKVTFVNIYKHWNSRIHFHRVQEAPRLHQPG